MARRRVNTTKYEIIRCATAMFIEKGYTVTSPKAICDELDISTGNLTYYFPTKEHLLAELVEMLCSFQWRLMQEEASDGISQVMALCLELTSMAAATEQDDIAKDFFLAAYRSPLCLAIIRKKDRERAKQVFAEYTVGWTEEKFIEAQTLVSGIEYATLMTTDESVSLEMRIAGAIDCVLGIYQVPPEIRKIKIDKALALDYRAIARRIFKDFKAFVEENNEHTLEEMVRRKYGR